MPNDTERVLDRRPPPNYNHVAKYPARRGLTTTTVANVERALMPPSPQKYRVYYDQGSEGACVGFGESITMSILNRKLYDPWWLYREAQIVDPWPETPPEEGTDLASGFDVLRTRGHRRMYAHISRPVEIEEGIVSVNRWTTNIDEDRSAIAEGIPVVDGIAWFEGFDRRNLVERRVKVQGREKVEYWVQEPDKWGRLRGYHCICRPIASDLRQAFGWLNSWGMEYPWPVWVSYESRAKLQQVDGESAIVTDR